MSQPTFDEDDSDDDDDDRDDDPSPSDQDDSEEEDTLPCPFCKKPVYERSDICPHCGNFISFEAESAYPRKLWFLVGVVLALGVVIMCYVAYVVFIVRRARP